MRTRANSSGTSGVPTFPFDAINAAVARLSRDLLGWWWSVGWCQVSADATIAPHGDGPDIYLSALDGDDRFNSGFQHDARGTDDVAASLRVVINEAIEAKAALTPDQHAQAREHFEASRTAAVWSRSISLAEAAHG